MSTHWLLQHDSSSVQATPQAPASGKPPLLEPLELPELPPLLEPLELPEPPPLLEPLELPEPPPLPPPELVELPPPSFGASTEASAEPFPSVSVAPPHRAVRTIKPASATPQTK